MVDNFKAALDRRTLLDESHLAARGFNYYEALGVSPSASSREIREAYQAAVVLASPSRLEQSTSAYYRYLNEALDVLTNESMREAYDESLGNISTFVERRFSPSSVAFPDLGGRVNWIEPCAQVRVVPKRFGRVGGLVSGLGAAVGLILSAWFLPHADVLTVVGWGVLAFFAALFLHFHPKVKSTFRSVPLLGYGLGVFVFCAVVVGQVSVPLWSVLLSGLLMTFGFAGVGEWWRSRAIRAGGVTEGFPLSEEYVLKHREMGTAGESWRWMARKSQVSSANLTRETFTQQMTADILMRLTVAGGVRLLHGIDRDIFLPHVLVAGNKVAVVEGIIVDDTDYTYTSRGILEPATGDEESVLVSVPAGVASLETFKRGLEVRGWVLVISHHGAPLQFKYKGDSGAVRVGDAKTVLSEISEFFSEDDSKAVLDLSVINALWQCKTNEK